MFALSSGLNGAQVRRQVVGRGREGAGNDAHHRQVLAGGKTNRRGEPALAVGGVRQNGADVGRSAVHKRPIAQRRDRRFVIGRVGLLARLHLLAVGDQQAEYLLGIEFLRRGNEHHQLVGRADVAHDQRQALHLVGADPGQPGNHSAQAFRILRHLLPHELSRIARPQLRRPQRQQPHRLGRHVRQVRRQLVVRSAVTANPADQDRRRQRPSTKPFSRIHFMMISSRCAPPRSVSRHAHGRQRSCCSASPDRQGTIALSLCKAGAANKVRWTIHGLSGSIIGLEGPSLNTPRRHGCEPCILCCLSASWRWFPS